MRAHRKSSRGPLSLALVLTACSSWRVESDPLPAPLDGRTISVIRVLTRNGERIIVHSARLSGDSIVGLSRPPDDGNARRIAIATDNVAQLERPAFDPGKTVFVPIAVLGVSMLALVLLAAFTCQPA